MNSPHRSSKVIHPLWMRITHWLNAVAVVVLVTSGWRIYNAVAASSISAFLRG